MVSAQIERLKKDSRELSQYSRKLEKKGRHDLKHKIDVKQDYLDQVIADIEEQKNTFN